MSKLDLRNGDALVELKTIPNESIDLVITDPPYRVTSKGCSGTMGGYWTSEKSKKGIIFDHNNISCEEYLPELYRVLKDKTLCYVMCNNINLVSIITTGINVGFHFVKCLIWDKGNKICGRYYMTCFEYIILFRKGGDRPINNCGTPDILSVPIKKLKDENNKNLHDTEKPVELAKILIENSSNKDEIVLDPFMGIGWAGIASKQLGRNFIGIEIDPKYFNIAKDRVDKAEIIVSSFEKVNLFEED